MYWQGLAAVVLFVVGVVIFHGQIPASELTAAQAGRIGITVVIGAIAALCYAVGLLI